MTEPARRPFGVIAVAALCVATALILLVQLGGSAAQSPSVLAWISSVEHRGRVDRDRVHHPSVVAEGEVLFQIAEPIRRKQWLSSNAGIVGKRYRPGPSLVRTAGA